jgi:predicted phage tail protein
MFFSPGDVIQVADNAKNRIRNGGLVAAVTANRITIDSPLTLSSSTTKKIFLTLPNETVVEMTISNGAGTFTEINLTTPLTTLPAPESPWQITDTLSRVQLYRITEVNPVEDNLNLFDITAKTYSADYYTQIESGIKVPVIVPVARLPVVASPPSDVVCRLRQINYGDRISFTLVASWKRPTKIVNGVTVDEPYTDRYRVEFKRGETSEWGSAQITTQLSARWENIGNGFFVVRVAAITTNNKVSAFVESGSFGQDTADFSNQFFTSFTGEF